MHPSDIAILGILLAAAAVCWLIGYAAGYGKAEENHEAEVVYLRFLLNRARHEAATFTTSRDTTSDLY